MRVAILQPSYLPWLGYLDQIASVDAFVFYDDVQYDRHGWRNRNRIRAKTEQGWSWLTIPVLLEHAFPPIHEVHVDARVPWRRKHLGAFHAAYGKERGRDFFEHHFGTFYAEESSAANLSLIATESVRRLMNAFGITTPLYRSSELNIHGDRTTRLVNICKHFGARIYLSGIAAKAYLNVGAFEAAGIAVEWQAFVHPEYPQRLKPFISHLSSVDALLNLGEDARYLLQRFPERHDHPSVAPHIFHR